MEYLAPQARASVSRNSKGSLGPGVGVQFGRSIGRVGRAAEGCVVFAVSANRQVKSRVFMIKDQRENVVNRSAVR
jgi:hypothetical protein